MPYEAVASLDREGLETIIRVTNDANFAAVFMRDNKHCTVYGMEDRFALVKQLEDMHKEFPISRLHLFQSYTVANSITLKGWIEIDNLMPFDFDR